MPRGPLCAARRACAGERSSPLPRPHPARYPTTPHLGPSCSGHWQAAVGPKAARGGDELLPSGSGRCASADLVSPSRSLFSHFPNSPLLPLFHYQVPLLLSLSMGHSAPHQMHAGGGGGGSDGDEEEGVDVLMRAPRKVRLDGWLARCLRFFPRLSSDSLPFSLLCNFCSSCVPIVAAASGKAIESGDTDLVYVVLFHAYKKRSLQVGGRDGEVGCRRAA